MSSSINELLTKALEASNSDDASDETFVDKSDSDGESVDSLSTKSQVVRDKNEDKEGVEVLEGDVKEDAPDFALDDSLSDDVVELAQKEWSDSRQILRPNNPVFSEVPPSFTYVQNVKHVHNAPTGNVRTFKSWCRSQRNAIYPMSYTASRPNDKDTRLTHGDNEISSAKKQQETCVPATSHPTNPENPENPENTTKDIYLDKRSSNSSMTGDKLRRLKEELAASKVVVKKTVRYAGKDVEVQTLMAAGSKQYNKEVVRKEREKLKFNTSMTRIKDALKEVSSISTIGKSASEWAIMKERDEGLQRDIRDGAADEVVKKKDFLAVKEYETHMKIKRRKKVEQLN